MTNTKFPPIQNPELEKVINDLKQGSTPEKQEQLSEELKKAQLLSPCDFDVQFQQEQNGQFRMQIHHRLNSSLLIQMTVKHSFQYSQVLKMQS